MGLFVGLNDIAGSGLQRSVGGYVFPVAGFTIGSCLAVIVTDDKEGVIVHLHICPVHIERKCDELPILSFQIQLVDDAVVFEHDPKAREMRLDTIEDAYIEGTKRNFVEKGVYGDSYREDEKPILVVSMKAAWNVDETPYIEMSKKYNVDFRVYGYEMGLEFNREIEIVEGRLVTNRRIKFKDYKWECPDPTLGG